MSHRRRNAIVMGLSFVVLSLAYFGFAPVLGYKVEWAGATMLFALGAAIGIMSYVLTAGSSD